MERRDVVWIRKVGLREGCDWKYVLKQLCRSVSSPLPEEHADRRLLLRPEQLGWIQEVSAMLYVIEASHRGKAWGRCLCRFAGHGSNRATPPMRMMVGKRDRQRHRREQRLSSWSNGAEGVPVVMFAGVVASMYIESLEAWKLEVRMMTKTLPCRRSCGDGSAIRGFLSSTGARSSLLDGSVYRLIAKRPFSRDGRREDSNGAATKL